VVSEVKPTKIWTLVGWAVSATTAGYLIPKLIVAGGGPIPVSPWNIIATLPAIGILLLLMAIPLIRYRRALAALKKDTALPRPKRINPFYAVRLVVLSKAIAISGAIFFGWHLGVVWLQITSPIIPTSTGQNALGLVGAALMLVLAVVVERLCRVVDDLPPTSGNSEMSAA
jgi:hypothetical protein